MGFDTIIKVSGTIPALATTNDIASIDIPEDGLIMCLGGVILGSYAPSPATSVNISLELIAELSFNSTNQIASNDSRGGIGGVAVSSSLIYSEATETGGAGAKMSEMNSLCFSDGIIINAGERIHLHGISNQTGLTATATFMMYIKSKGGGRRDSRRR